MFERLAQFIEKAQEFVALLRTVGRRIDADDRIAIAQQKSVDGACEDAARVIGRMVGLNAR